MNARNGGHKIVVAAGFDPGWLPDFDDPLGWLLAREALAEVEASNTSVSDQAALADAYASLNAPARRAPGWTGAAPAERTAERRRASALAASRAGQQEFGWRS